ncbi:MAG: hypothetical protein UU47_C0018G0008 [candidate division TM6 bacterium GW2011_GWE2_41_16]|nr:MAG: hypothetical protein UU47_C0018G0008 [candidate division TM6 bacterium GW2011_GWE2_41_16]
MFYSCTFYDGFGLRQAFYANLMIQAKIITYRLMATEDGAFSRRQNYGRQAQNLEDAHKLSDLRYTWYTKHFVFF